MVNIMEMVNIITQVQKNEQTSYQNRGVEVRSMKEA